MKLALGTAQFGLDYGINNTTGKVKLNDVKKILAQALQNNILTLDTAAIYGESETVLGKFGVGSFKVISKLPKCDITEVEYYLENSLKATCKAVLYGYLFHDFSSYLDQPSQYDILLKFKEEGKIEKIGFSLYQPRELYHLLDKGVNFDLVQIPFSVLDKRFFDLLPVLYEKNIEIHTRSTFLQGIIFLSHNKLHNKFKKLVPILNRLQDIAKRENLSMLELALSYAISINEITNVIVGIDNLDQFNLNVRAAEIVLNPWVINELDNIRLKDADILIPSNWN